MSDPMSETMTAIAVEGGKGPADALRPGTVARPQPGPGQILVRVRAAGVNRPDLLQRLGFYPPPPGAPTTLGLEVAGEVVIGAGRWKAGDKICALLGGGGYAQYAVVDARHALPYLTVSTSPTPPPCPRRSSRCSPTCSNMARSRLARRC